MVVNTKGSRSILTHTGELAKEKQRGNPWTSCYWVKYVVDAYWDSYADRRIRPWKTTSRLGAVLGFLAGSARMGLSS